MNFRKNFEIGEGSFPIPKFRCKFSAGRHNFGKNRNIFPKKGGEGGGQRPFGNFPNIHRYWYRQASLILIVDSVEWNLLTCGRNHATALICTLPAKEPPISWLNCQTVTNQLHNPTVELVETSLSGSDTFEFEISNKSGYPLPYQ